MEASVRDNLNEQVACNLCGNTNDLMLCAGCKEAWYCSKNHQKQHWKQHRVICKAKSAAAGGSQKLSSQDKNHLVSQKPSADVKHDLTAGLGDGNTQGMYKESSEVFDFLLSNMPSSNVDPKTNSAQSGFQKEVKIADYVLKCLGDYGICVVDNFMGTEKCDNILKEVAFLDQSSVMQAGELVSKVDTSRKVRGDKITWIEKGDPACPHISSLVQRLDSIVLTCNGKLNQYTINGRTKAMVACYPGNGTYYMRHVDNPNEDGRCVTCIYYLNKDWDISRHGGLLRIFPSKFNQVADIEPKFDRLLFFWSDRRNPHEVQPAFRTRYAITVWYFDAEERLRAKLKHQTRVDDSGLCGL